MQQSEQAPPFAATKIRSERLEALTWAFASSPALALVSDAAGRVVWLNDAAGRRWGDVLGSEAPTLVPEGPRESMSDALHRVLDSGEASRFEWGEHGPEGVRAWFACTASPLLDEGKVVGALFVSTDATELKRSEERHRLRERLMVDAQGVAHLGTWEWNVSEPNAIWSDELFRIYGLTPEVYTPSYEQYLTMVHPDDRQRVIDATNLVFHEHVPYSHDERIFRPDGSIRHLHTWAYPELDEAGRLTKLVGVCQDITDRKLIEEALHELNHELERRVAERTRTIESSMKDLESFNSMVSHDLRAPLTVIVLQCGYLLRKGALPPEAAEKVERIRRSAARMGELITDLLNLARLGQGTIEREEVDLSALSTDVLANLRRASPGRVADIEVASGLKCLGDAGLLRAALENLLGNAWKYSSKVERARIAVGSTEVDGRRAFFVRDNGAGFDMKEAPRLFAAFQRLHDSSEFEGTGVGLAAVHRIIDRHGGRIWAESEPGQGATFYFELPGT